MSLLLWLLVKSMRREKLAKKPRLPRVERTEDYHLEDETLHLWAISYADFLMVLLSFFILFFSTDAVDKNSIIYQISKHVNQKMGEGGSKAGGSGSASGSSTAASAPDSSGAATGSASSSTERDVASLKGNAQALAEALKAHSVSVAVEQQKILFNFPDNIYAVGEYSMTDEVKEVLKDTLTLLQPYYGSIDITIVGHTDSTNVRQSSAKLIKNNFDLSVFRATRALEGAISMGAPVNILSAKGSADLSRNSRTLSLIVTANLENK